MNFSNEILGGILIGLSSVLPLLIYGRVAGISGYASSALRPKSEDGKTGLFLVIGLVLGGLAWKFLSGTQTQITEDHNLLTWAAAGLLVGFGARLGGGCTSGHGICGLGRLSHRSLGSVLIFMSAAIATNLILRGIGA